MKPTNAGNPDYYHRVVDCQWACPAHTDVPEYIRLIAQGKYTESYLLNREMQTVNTLLSNSLETLLNLFTASPVAAAFVDPVSAGERDHLGGGGP